MRPWLIRTTSAAIILPLATACAWLTWHNHTRDTPLIITAPGMPLILWTPQPPNPTPTPYFDFNGKRIYLTPLAKINQQNP